MAATVTIAEDQFLVATAVAQQTLAMFAGKPGHYTNNLNSHLRGKVGEIACAAWLSGLGVGLEPLFLDVSRISEADIVIPGPRLRRLDVKTWDVQHWNDLGRCVAVDQLEKLNAKSEGVVWCHSPTVLAPGVSVEIVGWSTIADIRAAPVKWTGPSGGRQVNNHQVEAPSVRSTDSLIAWASA